MAAALAGCAARRLRGRRAAGRPLVLVSCVFCRACGPAAGRVAGQDERPAALSVPPSRSDAGYWKEDCCCVYWAGWHALARARPGEG